MLQKSVVVSAVKRHYALPVASQSTLQAVPAREEPMISPVTRLLSVLLLCALPALGFAAETTPADDPKAAPPQAAATAGPAPLPAASAPAATQQPVRIGYIDVARIGTESELGKASRTQVEGKQKKLQTQLESKRKQLDKQKAALEASFATLTPAQREAKAKGFQKKVEEFQTTVLKAEKELQGLQIDLETALAKAVEQAAAEYGKANGLSLVIVKRELLYMASGVEAEDVTDGIVTLMDAKDKK
jgi:outer membrane protein